MPRPTSFPLAIVAVAIVLGACSMERPTAPATATPQLSGMLAPCQQTDTGCVDPMLIIDGKVAAFRDLNLNGTDVESIEVVKGDEALRRYGDAGRHGVVVITTKRAAEKR